MSIAIITDRDSLGALDFRGLALAHHVREGAGFSCERFDKLRAGGIEAVLLLEAGLRLHSNSLPSDEHAPASGGPCLGIVRDQIAFLDVTVDSPGPEGVRFTDMTTPFDVGLTQAIASAAMGAGLQTRDICIAGVRRIDLLTPAEMKALIVLGGEAAVERIHLETRRARERGLRVAAVVPWRMEDNTASAAARKRAASIWEALNAVQGERKAQS